MIITLSELNKAIKALPKSHIAREMDRTFWRVPIEPEMQLLYEEPSLFGPKLRIATFELKKVAHYGSVRLYWVPCDEVIID